MQQAAPPAPTPRADTIIGRLTALGLGLAALMLAVGALALANAREDARRGAEQAGANLALALERDIARYIGSLDLSIQGAIDGLALPGLAQVSPAIRHTALFDRAATAEFLDLILVLDAAGRIVESSTPLAAPETPVNERDYFTAHRDAPNLGLYLSLPHVSRIRGGEPNIAISRRIAAPDNSFAGVVAGSLRLAYFQSLFDRLDLGAHGLVALTRIDGVLVAKRPGASADAGRDVGNSPAFHRMLGQPAGSFIDRSMLDGEERLVSFRRVGELPLLLTVGLATRDIYAPWWRKALEIGSVLGSLSIATVALSLLVRREMLRRIGAQRALQDAIEQLRVMAETDGLTGLLNRRAFYEELQAQWRQAARRGSEVALLMLDADFFKPYNDLYGHQAGDSVLQRLATALDALAARPSDLVGRVGGEEFAVLLPETGLQGGQVIADRIRRAIHDLAIPHAGSPHGRVSFCIGVAATRPAAESDPADLLKQADDAMYRAKAAGRDRIELAYPAPTGSAGIGGTPPASIAEPAASSRSSR